VVNTRETRLALARLSPARQPPHRLRYFLFTWLKTQGSTTRWSSPTPTSFVAGVVAQRFPVA